MKTSELKDIALNWAVAKCEGHEAVIKYAPVQVMYTPQGKRSWYIYRPTTNWAQGGPIIEREGISVAYDVEMWQEQGREYWATLYAVDSGEGRVYGPTPLIAALRCYVASKLGDEVEIPKELT